MNFDRHYRRQITPVRRVPAEAREHDAYAEARRLREIRHREIAERSMWDADALGARIVSAGCFVCVALAVVVVGVYAG